MLKIIILYIFYKIINSNLMGKIINVILPFILSFVLAYIFYPLLKKMKKYMSTQVSVLIIVLILILCIFILLYLIIPLFIREFDDLINLIIYLISNLSSRFKINLNDLYNKINTLFNYQYLIKSLNISIDLITKIILCFICFIYMLIDMDKIYDKVKDISNKKIMGYLYLLDKNLRKYISSLIKISIISFIEYSLAFLLINHDEPILMGFIAGITNLIPYIGSIFVLIFGILICPNLIIKVSILYFIMGLIDSYIINPYIYGKYNKINPIISLISMSIAGFLFGIKGFIFSIPLTIIVINTYNYFRNDIIYYVKKKIIDKI